MCEDVMDEAYNKRSRGRPPSKSTTKSPRQKASVKSLAEERPSLAAGGDPIDDRVLDRIKKCLKRANHENSTESEAKAALFLSQKLMTQHNVTHADLLSKESDEQVQVAGSSIVAITSTKDGSNSVRNEGFVFDAAHAMQELFDCQCYASREFNSIEWTFYGIAENTVAAARAFEMVYNLISQWALAYKGVSARFSYACGVASGLRSMAYEEKCQEAEMARKAELETLNERIREDERQRQEELARLNPVQSEFGPISDDQLSSQSMVLSPTGLGNPGTTPKTNNGDGDGDASSDDEEAGCGFTVEPDFKEADGDLLDPTADLDEEIGRLLKREASPFISLDGIKSEEEKQSHSSTSVDTAMPRDIPVASVPAASPWKSEMQLIRFRQTSKKVGDDYLKQQNIRLCTTARRYTDVRDASAYRQGLKDSNKVDVRRRRLE
ncbi:hypothetical protein H112_04178 [Trichophyton rubrum D6]|uniref:Uncharacterized protein n=4 Tax=Trichophyton TaxID=5550 RepID=A0A178F416_TRIRU|nr:uncharacterized protein TERG_03956 [Trichophyton rubrum CBS 118892]EZF23069.1 hypothetical protein H100_04183 [Trichophyton rubrum MR850]EZF42065.1 hypothetical protein H102_04172 [Trichophyton rubrum CBS 100081]EZF52720.1 hypothetical protein H103_04180 [Trichophyton rubrum CBS 288.86]EZF63321.1 hypothetical protein H104_04169 [Trichophyton rubrum CBS 289.86]EZF73858.1 hypothetical protein H105_04197 [Trichophyton soudanense CBS 452.61]EZF84633.1 hypothetical protein H110_04173 [Trichophy